MRKTRMPPSASATRWAAWPSAADAKNRPLGTLPGGRPAAFDGSNARPRDRRRRLESVASLDRKPAGSSRGRLVQRFWIVQNLWTRRIGEDLPAARSRREG